MLKSARSNLQYLYFLRFSLMLWLFPPIFAALDSGWFPVSTTTLTRGIFVPETPTCFLCVAFFILATGCVSLILARTVVLNGVERFSVPVPTCLKERLENDKKCAGEASKASDAPEWLAKLLRNGGTGWETLALLIAMLPSLFAFGYLLLCGYSEGLSFGSAGLGLGEGTIMASLFWYFMNAWYYLAYEAPVPPSVGAKVELGKNAARTLLLPRALFGLRKPGTPALPTNGALTLEDIGTSLRRSKLSRWLQRIACKLDQEWDLAGYFYPNGHPYEAQLFSFISAIGFMGLYWSLYPLTAPVFSNWSWLAVAGDSVAVFLLHGVIWSGKVTPTGECLHTTNDDPTDCGQCMQDERSMKKRLLKWQLGLTSITVVFFGFLIFAWTNSYAERFPTLATIVLLVTLLVWTLSAIAFAFDRYRVPVLTVVLMFAMLRILNIYNWSAGSIGPFEEHYLSTKEPKNKDVKLPTPAEVLAQRLWLLQDEAVKSKGDERPLIIVTSTGGGLHAAAWTNHVMRELYKELARGNDAGDKLGLTNHILMMSTVSGGSVGLKYYLEALESQQEKSEPLQQENPDLDSAVVNGQCSSLEAVGWGLLYYDFTKVSAPVAPFWMWPSPGKDDLGTTPMWKDRTWALRRALDRNRYDGYCYLAASMDSSGWISQAELKERSPKRPPWYERFGREASLEPVTVGQLQAINQANPSKQFPAFSMNTTTAEHGERVLLANYRIPLYQLGEYEELPAESFLGIFNTGNRPDLPLATAAQMSATFPYVSSAARIPVNYSSYSQHFVDGGYYDNDGTASAIEFLRYALDGPGKESADWDAAGNNVALQDIDKWMRIGTQPKPQKTKSKGQAECPEEKETPTRKIKILLIEIRDSEDSATSNEAKIRRDHPQLTTLNGTPAITDRKPGLLQQLTFPASGFWSAGHESVTGRNRNELDLLVKQEAAKLDLHRVVFDYRPPCKKSRGLLNIPPSNNPLSWSLTPMEREDIAEAADPKGQLHDQYEKANQWFNSSRSEQ